MGPAGSAPPVFFAVPDNSDSPGVTSTPSPDHRYQSPRSNPNVPNAAPNSKVIHPPAFKPQKYNSWRRELLFWKDLYFYINPYQLLATLGAHANSLLKVNLMKYMAQTTDCPAGRSAIGLLGVLYVIYASSSKERTSGFLYLFASLKREPSETFQSFSNKFEILTIRLQLFPPIYPTNCCSSV